MGLYLKDKVAIITGASSGIGAATAVIFAREGANVVIVGRNEANLKTVAEKCGKVGKKAFPIKAEITKDDEAADVIKKTIAKFGRLDILVNSAGILKFCSILDQNIVAIFDETMKTNIRAVVVLTSQAAPHLIETKGNIVNVSSIAGSRHRPGNSSYCTSKAALNHFSRTIASELASKGVRVNTISPGPVGTPMLDAALNDLGIQDFKSMTALNRISQPEEIGELIAYLASEKAACITGVDYLIDCGCNVK